jgi:hypothetical protein
MRGVDRSNTSTCVDASWRYFRFFYVFSREVKFILKRIFHQNSIVYYLQLNEAYEKYSESLGGDKNCTLSKATSNYDP